MFITNLETTRTESIIANYDQFFEYCMNKEIFYDGENESFEHIKYTTELLEGNVEFGQYIVNFGWRNLYIEPQFDSNKQHEILVTKERINLRLRIHERECFVVNYNA